MAKIWDIPFASAGDKQAIPVPVQSDGTVSTTQGWTPDYELPNTNPSYKPVGREEMNGALFEITESIQQLQLQGAAEWSNLFPAYQKGAEVIHSGERWRSLIDGNTEEPGTGPNWTQAGFIAAATETVSGILRIATAAENAAGTLQGIAVDPLGIREAFNATGSAPVFACRAWVRTTGITGTIAAAGNVSSVTNSSTGRYVVNFTVAMPDGNYACTATTKGQNNFGTANSVMSQYYNTAPAAGSCELMAQGMSSFAANNVEFSAAFFR